MTRLFWTEKCCLTLLYFSTWASDNNFYLEKITLSKNFQKIPSWSWCYKTFFGGNLDFPKIKNGKKYVLMSEPGLKCENKGTYKQN